MKRLFGENEVDAVLQRLDRLTQDEARTTAAQTLEVVYGLVQNMRVVIEGKRLHLASQLLVIERAFLKTARHQLRVFGSPLVTIIYNNGPILWLTRR